jgi:hypothetical protein
MGKTKPIPFNIYIMVQAKKLESNQTLESLTELYKSNGKEGKLFNDSGLESFIPGNVIFGETFWQTMEPVSMSHFRIQTQDAKDLSKVGNVAVSRIHLSGIKKVGETDTLPESSLIFRKIPFGEFKGKNSYQIALTPETRLNKSVMGSDEVKTQLNLQGKVFKATVCNRFDVPAEVWTTKQEAIDSARAKIYYELSEVK